MPIYEYQCPKCGRVTESFVQCYRDKKKTVKCPDCGARARSIMSIPGMCKVDYFKAQKFLKSKMDENKPKRDSGVT